jgi:hypothetical protein
VSTWLTVERAEITPEWLALRREIIAREGLAVRGAACRGGFTIEVKSLRTNEWGPLGWHLGALCFATAAERDVVLGDLQA